MEFTNTTQMQFEPGASQQIDLGSVAEAYATPNHLRPVLGDLSRLSYLRTRWAVDLTADAGTTAVATVELMAGAGTVIDSVEIDFAGGVRAGASVETDLSSVPGAAGLWLRVTVDTADSGRAAVLRSWLQVEHPLIISNC